MLRRNHQRQPHSELRTLVLTRAFRPRSSAMQLNEVSDDGESESQSAVIARCRPVCLPKTIEHVWHKVWVNADARISHDNLDMRIDPLETDMHRPAALRELHTV